MSGWDEAATVMSRGEISTRRACLRAELPVTKRMVREAIERGALEAEPLQGGVKVTASSACGTRRATLVALGEEFALGAADKGTQREVATVAKAIAWHRDSAAIDPRRGPERIANVMQVFRCISSAGIETSHGVWPEADETTSAAIASVSAALREAEEQLSWAPGAAGEKPPERETPTAAEPGER